MAAVTQTIPSYLGGVSRQADKEKLPGMVKDVSNTYPDITFGMTKRPGLEYLHTMSGNIEDMENGHWFLFRRENQEAYIGYIHRGGLRVFNFATFNECKLFDADDNEIESDNAIWHYFRGDRNDYQTLQKDQRMLILNKTVVTLLDTVVAPGEVDGIVNTIAELPDPENMQPGAIWEIRGISGAADDYWLQWDGQTWNEVACPGSYIKFAPETMPHQLAAKYKEDGSIAVDEFYLTAVDWEVNEAGMATNNLDQGPDGDPEDDLRVAWASFLGHPINFMFFYKGRLSFLSRDNIIMSRPNEIRNFWRMSAMTTTDADPIDLTAASLRAVNLFAALPVTQGLLLFSEREQFVMTGGTSQLITPKTANIRSVSTFEMNTVIPPQEVGNQIMFTSLAPSYTRVYAMSVQGDGNSPNFTDIGKVVSEWIPDGLDRLGTNSQNSFLHLTGPKESSMYFYRYYVEGQQLIVKSWFKWDLFGNIFAAFTEQDTIFMAVRNQNTCMICRGYLNPTPTSATVIDSEGLVTVNPCIDLLARPKSLSVNGGVTLIEFPYSRPAPWAWSPIAIQISDPDDTSEGGAFWRLEPAVGTDGTRYQVDQDLQKIHDEGKLRIGFTFPYEIVLPKTYYRGQNAQADYTASLIISRMKFAMGKTGACGFEVRPRGATTFAEVGEVDQSNWYLLDTAPIDDERMFTVPIHQRNDNFDIRIASESPYPISLVSMAWEGQYSPRYYARS